MKLNRIVFTFCLFLIACRAGSCPIVLAEDIPKSKAAFAREFRVIETDGIAVIRQNFRENTALTEFIERYNESNDNSEWVSNFNAITSYVSTILEPSVVAPSEAQRAAFRKLHELTESHDKLQLEYQAIYRKLPSFD